MNASEPLIIPRSEHPISRQNISLNVLKVLAHLRRNGHTAYIVGGGVRDLLLGRRPKDMDVVTDATPARLKKIFRNCRLVGRRFRLAHVHFRDEIVEVATFRSPVDDADEATAEAHAGAEELPPRLAGIVKSEDGQILRDNVFGTPEQDARRRDFTLNALFYNIDDFSIIDYVGGYRDIRDRRIRSIGDPGQRFIEDPVRMIRAVRFAAALGFTLDEATRAALLEQRGLIVKASSERMFEEVRKLLLLGAARPTFEMLHATGLFTLIFPVAQGALPPGEGGWYFEHLRRVLDWVDARVAESEPVDLALLFALMFGPLIDRRAGELQGDASMGAVTAYKQTVGEFVAEMAPSVRIPNLVGLGIREILSQQWRFQRQEGRRATRFVRMPVFPFAWTYFQLSHGSTGRDPELVAWWESFLQGKPQPGAAPAEGPSPGRRRRRRRRGRRRSGEGAPPPLEFGPTDDWAGTDRSF
jgi:poly(A) polymerase